MRRTSHKLLSVLGIAALGVAMAVPVGAQGLLEKIKAGEPVRIGFSNEIPWAYPGDGNAPLGFVNAMTIDILEKMGTTNIEPIVTEWGSLIPGLQAGRFDIITGGMYILPERCRNALFTEPLGTFADALLVPTGNPQDLHSFDDIREKELTLVTGAGYNTVKNALDVGIADSNVMQVAGPAEILQAVKAGRADAGGGTYFTMKEFADKDEAVELAEPFTPPVIDGYPGLAFLPTQQAEVDAFNAALKEYIGSEEMMEAVSQYGYTEVNLPDGTTTAELCQG